MANDDPVLGQKETALFMSGCNLLGCNQRNGGTEMLDELCDCDELDSDDDET